MIEKVSDFVIGTAFFQVYINLGEASNTVKHEQYKKASPITGTKFIIGKTKDEPIAYIKNEEGLTMDSYWEIRKEAEELGLGNFPIHIHATVNGGPNGSKTYTFTQTY